MRLLFSLLLSMALAACGSKTNNNEASNSEADKKDVAQAEENMFNSIKTNDPNFWKTVSDSYITINADGIMANKQETINDSLRRKMFTGIDHKLFDHTIRVFGTIGICNGRAQFFMQNQMVAEIYYTAIFRKEKDHWIYEGWQGTMTKNNPKPA